MTDNVPDHGVDQGAPERAATNAAPASKNRRTMLKGGVAVAGGVVAAGYVKPNLRSLGVPGALAQVSPTSPPPTSPPPTSPPPTSPPPPPVAFTVGTLGTWKNGELQFERDGVTIKKNPIGPHRFDQLNDPHWIGVLGQPFVTTDLFNGPNSPFVPHPDLAGITIDGFLEILEKGNGDSNTPAQNAAAQLVAAYLNASSFGTSRADGFFPLTQKELKDLWAKAVGTPTLFGALNTLLTRANEGDEFDQLPCDNALGFKPC